MVAAAVAGDASLPRPPTCTRARRRSAGSCSASRAATAAPSRCLCTWWLMWRTSSRWAGAAPQHSSCAWSTTPTRRARCGRVGEGCWPCVCVCARACTVCLFEWMHMSVLERGVRVCGGLGRAQVCVRRWCFVWCLGVPCCRVQLAACAATPPWEEASLPPCGEAHVHDAFPGLGCERGLQGPTGSQRAAAGNHALLRCACAPQMPRTTSRRLRWTGVSEAWAFCRQQLPLVADRSGIDAWGLALGAARTIVLWHPLSTAHLA